MHLETIIRAMPADLEIVVVGGLAAQRYLPTYMTNDVDVCFHPTPVNWQRVVRWLAPFAPTLWIAHQSRPLQWDATTPMRDYTLLTQEGEIDLLQEIDGVGKYPQVKAVSSSAVVWGKTVWFLNLQGLIANKRAANRPKDRRLLRQLEDMQRRHP